MDIRHNLTRFWRSKTFEEIVGQQVPVRLLKNSLVKNRIFPVYLFSGLRGSGKTSIGRIFASALNCERLDAIQQERPTSYNPSTPCEVPCLQCASCIAMRAAEHPDFIEIDAASHTGVDNVRNIIESASFLPVMGRKKIYLIDEAHMLSKAAFNALLKILEEPPATVVFMLATTELHKIPDTVKSRTFQLFFEPIDPLILKNHLKKIGEHEGIQIEDQALDVIIRQSEGSVRDALNIMERVIITEGAVTYAATCQTLGIVREDTVVELLNIITRGSINELLAYLARENYEKYNPEQLWHAIINLLRGFMRPQEKNEDAALTALRKAYTESLALEFCDMLYRSELQLIRTSAQSPFVEHLLSKMCQRFSSPDRPIEPRNSSAYVPQKTESPAKTFAIAQHVASAHPARSVEPVAQGNIWQSFLHELNAANNPIALSLFKQASWQLDDEMMHIAFPKKFEFYQEWLVAQEGVWKPLLHTLFKKELVFSVEFINDASSNGPRSVEASIRSRENISRVEKTQTARQPQKAGELTLDLENEEKWKKVHMLKQVFPGTIRLNKE